MHDVCAIDELKPREPAAFRVGGTEIVLARWRDKVYAFRNRCPHQGQSFVCGNVTPSLISQEPGYEVVADERNPLLMCPWHTWGYELETGRCATEPSLRIRTYEVEIRDGRVLVGV